VLLEAANFELLELVGDVGDGAVLDVFSVKGGRRSASLYSGSICK